MNPYPPIQIQTQNHPQSETDKLLENANAFINTIIKLKPAAAKGQYVKSLFLSSSMGPGLKITKDEIPTR
ncbi:MAG: hypothetical protein IH819_08220 [Bacteroidetes bacterium]|nr:hypothetical protein [Bacteroidota bacterium]